MSRSLGQLQRVFLLRRLSVTARTCVCRLVLWREGLGIAESCSISISNNISANVILLFPHSCSVLIHPSEGGLTATVPKGFKASDPIFARPDPSDRHFAPAASSSPSCKPSDEGVYAALGADEGCKIPPARLRVTLPWRKRSYANIKSLIWQLDADMCDTALQGSTTQQQKDLSLQEAFCWGL